MKLLNVETPATLKLSKFVWPSTSKSPFASMLLENDAEVASIAPLNVVAVTTPAMLTLSKFVWPSTSKSFTILTTPLIVEIPAALIPVSCEPSPV